MRMRKDSTAVAVGFVPLRVLLRSGTSPTALVARKSILTARGVPGMAYELERAPDAVGSSVRLGARHRSKRPNL